MKTCDCLDRFHCPCAQIPFILSTFPVWLFYTFVYWHNSHSSEIMKEVLILMPVDVSRVCSHLIICQTLITVDQRPYAAVGSQHNDSNEMHSPISLSMCWRTASLLLSSHAIHYQRLQVRMGEYVSIIGDGKGITMDSQLWTDTHTSEAANP